MRILIVFLCILNTFIVSKCIAQENGASIEVSQLNSLVYNNPDIAIKKGEVLLRKINKKDVSNRINVYLILGVAYSSKENYFQGLNYGFIAYELVKNTKYKFEQIKVLGFIANQYYILQMEDKVDFYLKKAEQIISQLPKNNSMNYLAANIYTLQAIRYKDKLDCDFAINYFDKALSLYKASDNENNKYNLPIIYLQKAYCYFEQGKINLSENNFNIAFNISSKSDNNYVKYYSLIGLSMILTQKGEYKLSNDSLLKISNNINNSIPNDLQLEFYTALNENYIKLEDNQNYFHNFFVLKKIIEDNDKANATFVDKVLKEQQENLNKKYNKDILLYVILLIVIISLSFFISLKLKRKNN